MCHTGDRVRVCGAGVAGAWGSVQAQGRLEPAGTLQGLSAEQLQCLTPPALSGCWRVTAGAGAAPAVATAVPHLPWLLGGWLGSTGAVPPLWAVGCCSLAGTWIMGAHGHTVPAQ